MIVGIGSDIIDILRIEKVLFRFNQRFKNRVFTDLEVIKCDGRRLSVNSYAKRYAAKEACSKALGTGFRKGVYWKDIEIRNNKDGKPEISLHNGAKKRLETLIPDGNIGKLDLSITDEYPYAQATVIITYYKSDR
ncbi:MAG: holo-ACP synthase [Hyphomicrobiales bacterium]|nr:holo-ACP synthase [Hyphomicrobiales bacterium]